MNKKNQKVRQFIQQNHDLVKRYYSCYYNRYKEENFKEQLRILFVNALNAGGIGKITEKASSIRSFESKLKKMNKPVYSEFLNVFGAKSYLNLFESLKKFRQMGPKKSALFLRDIFYFNNIILECPRELKEHFLIPVDRVITRTIHSLYPEINLKTKAFDKINQLGKEIFPNEPILLEDLWFWGRFYRCPAKKKNKDISYCKFNRDLLEVDINVTPKYRTELIEFVKTHKECPFKDICLTRNQNPSR